MHACGVRVCIFGCVRARACERVRLCLSVSTGARARRVYVRTCVRASVRAWRAYVRACVRGVAYVRGVRACVRAWRACVACVGAMRTGLRGRGRADVGVVEVVAHRVDLERRLEERVALPRHKARPRHSRYAARGLRGGCEPPSLVWESSACPFEASRTRGEEMLS